MVKSKHNDNNRFSEKLLKKVVKIMQKYRKGQKAMSNNFEIMVIRIKVYRIERFHLIKKYIDP